MNRRGSVLGFGLLLAGCFGPAAAPPSTPRTTEAPGPPPPPAVVASAPPAPVAPRVPTGAYGIPFPRPKAATAHGRPIVLAALAAPPPAVVATRALDADPTDPADPADPFLPSDPFVSGAWRAHDRSPLLGFPPPMFANSPPPRQQPPQPQSRPYPPPSPPPRQEPPPAWRRLFAAFDGDTGAPIWEAPIDLGEAPPAFVTSTGDAYESSEDRNRWEDAVAISGDDVVVLQHGDAAYYDLATGRPDGTVPLLTASSIVCSEAATGRLYVTSGWMGDPTLDAMILPSRQIVPSPYPTTCTPRIRCKDADCADAWPKVAGFHEPGVVGTTPEGARVVLGARAAGRHVPMVGVIGATGHAVKWSTVVPTPDEEPIAREMGDTRRAVVVGGRLFVAYDAWLKRPRLAAFDHEDGSRLWSVPIRELAPITASGDRVYVSDHNLGIRVYDAATGAAL